MTNRPSIGAVIWISVKPIVKMAVVAAGGAIFARKGLLTPEACRANASVILNLLLPLLIFSTVIPSFGGNMKSALILVITGFFYEVMGLIFGFIVRWFTPCPAGWKGGVLAAGIFNNWGDLIIAYISSLGLNQPFNGTTDVDKGTAYSSIFMIVQMLSLYNLGGMQLIRSDFVKKERTDVEQQKPSFVNSTTSAIANRIQQTTESLTRGVSSMRRRPSTTPGSQRPNALPLARLSCEGAPSGGPNIELRSMASTLPTINSPSVTAPASPTGSVFEGEASDSVMPTAVNSRVPSHHAPSILDYEDCNSLHKQPTTKETPLNAQNVNIALPQPTGWRRVLSKLQPFVTPPSISLISALVIANVPTLKALFTATDGSRIPNAPDNKPPLDFVMEISAFGGQAVPVLGMVLLGAALSRLQLNNLPKGFWKTVVSMSVLKLVVGSIIGVVWTTQVMTKTGLMDPNDLMLKFVMVMTSGVPTATSQVYITNLFAPTSGDSKSMEISALSAMLLSQYILMLPTLATLVSYTLLDVL